MALSGTLGDFSLSDILQLIGLQRKTGHLVLRRGEEEVVIGFDQGRVVSAESKNRVGETKVGQLLVRTGKLSEERLAEALKRQKSTLQRLGHLLVEQGWVDRETVRRQLLLQITETVYDLFRWKDGEYDFRPEARVEWDRGFVEPIPSENLLMEGVRMVDEWPLVERVIPSRAVVMRTTARGAKLLATVGTARDQGDLHQSVYDEDIDFGVIPADPMTEDSGGRFRLSERERAVLRWVDARRTAGEVAELSGLGSFETFHVMAELVEDGILEIAPSSSAEAAAKVPALLRAGSPARIVHGLVLALALLGLLGGVQGLWRALFPGTQVLPTLSPIADAEALARTFSAEGWRDANSAARLERIERALDAAFLDSGRWPAGLQELAEKGLLPASALVNPWGQPYGYRLAADGFALVDPRDGVDRPRLRERRFGGPERLGGRPPEAPAPAP